MACEKHQEIPYTSYAYTSCQTASGIFIQYEDEYR